MGEESGACADSRSHILAFSTVVDKCMNRSGLVPAGIRSRDNDAAT